jgi:hypothetical protein
VRAFVSCARVRARAFVPRARARAFVSRVRACAFVSRARMYACVHARSCRVRVCMRACACVRACVPHHDDHEREADAEQGEARDGDRDLPQVRRLPAVHVRVRREHLRQRGTDAAGGEPGSGVGGVSPVP